MRTIRFFNPEQQEFGQVLKQRVDDYFTVNNISPYANTAMVVKIAAVLLAFAGSYTFLVIAHPGGVAAFLLCCLLGLATAGIGLIVSHHAAHNTFSRNKKVNRALSLTFNMAGVSDYIWKIKHNVFHHAYTNVYELDEGLKEGEAIRLSEEAPRSWYHRFQHYYSFPLYAIFTVLWTFILDFEKLGRYAGNGSRNPEAKHPKKELLIFWLTKIYYVGIAFVIPHYVAGYSWMQVLGGFLLVNCIASLIVTLVFQVEHVVEETKHTAAGEDGIVRKSWEVNQLEGTSNFKCLTPVFEWYMGGSNYQVEHHLFPHICPIHYPAISKIVEQTAKEFNLPYNRRPSFVDAIRSHYRTLRTLGKPTETIAA